MFQEALRDVSAAHGVAISGAAWIIIERAIYAAIREAVRAFTAIHEELRHKVAAALSHDMRTALAVIANGAQLIELAGDLAQARRLGQKIAASALRLDSMVDDVLDALTAPKGARLPLRLSQFDMRELIEQVRREFAGRYPCAPEAAAPRGPARYAGAARGRAPSRTQIGVPNIQC
ncbi:HAMP domain-containing histidine kinase [Massilia genomosp. 1]|uniref:histidine kinase n=1 Tax=Massilia genomosp. 1 TaxID=2609280 RepID=A0ABX0MUT2_9BURK|nr:HAMP domain-containing histidine kinase [Massilia genomosp. 1]NHZ66524.1 hypothetical protein [Massilia genomosp. 1]